MIIKSQLPRESEICKIVKAPEIIFRAAIQRRTKDPTFYLTRRFFFFFFEVEDEAPSFRSSALARVVDRARFLSRSVTRQEGTSSCRRRVRESGQLRPGSRATTSADFHCGGRRCVHDAFVRAHAYAYARVQGEIIERFRVLSIQRATSAPGVSIGAFATTTSTSRAESACDEAQERSRTRRDHHNSKIINIFLYFC